MDVDKTTYASNYTDKLCSRYVDMEGFFFSNFNIESKRLLPYPVL